MTVIALYRYRRQHGGWPTSLAQLVPQYLPEVPLDQFDGQPLRYRVENGDPLLYSVGVDAVDDHGRPPDDDEYKLPKDGDGDLILWPPIHTASELLTSAED